jgi:PAS domain S-box-containing protein
MAHGLGNEGPLSPGGSPSRDDVRCRLQLAALLAGLTDAVLITDAEGRFLHYNQAFATFHRFASREDYALALGPDSLDLLTPDGDRVPFDAWPMRRALRGESAEFAVYTLRRKDTGEAWSGSFRFAPIRNPDGGIAGSVVLAHELHERRAAASSIRKSDEPFKTIFEASPDAILIRRTNGCYLEANAVALERYGYSLDELRLMTPEDLAAPDLKDKVPALVEEALRTGLPVEWVHQKKDGTLVPVELLVREFHLHAVPCLFTSARDITSRKVAEAETARLQAQLLHAERLESMGSLAGGVAHDMNNVLGAILALASVQQLKTPEGSDLHRDLETIAKACLRGSTMAKSLLGFARQSLAEERELDLNTVVHEGVSLLARTTLQKVQFATELAPDLCPITGDPAALCHALMNLCVNAVDAMPDKGVLTIRTWNERGMAVLEVVDTGIGMTQEVLNRALEPFFTTKQNKGGTGLGLALTYGTVKAHRGRLEISSEPGEGTRVRVLIPACAARASAASLPPMVPPSGPTRPMRVLLVDDDELIQIAVRGLLEALGHMVTTVSGGGEALARLQAGLQPEVVVLDMNMPALNGADTLPLLRSLRPALPVLLATGQADQAAMNLVSAHSRVALMPKPFSLAELQRHLEWALRETG